MDQLKYRLGENYRLVELNESAVILASEKESVVVRSPIAVRILRSLDKQPLAISNLLQGLDQGQFISNALVNLQQLERSGYITLGGSGFSEEEAGYWRTLGYDPRKIEKVIKNKVINLVALGGVREDLFVAAFSSLGFRLEGESDIDIVLTSSYLDPKLNEINERALKDNKPWILVKPMGTRPLIGPLFLPADPSSVCLVCLQQRIKLHNQGNIYFQSVGRSELEMPRPLIGHPASMQNTVWKLAHEVISHLYGENNQFLINQIIELGPGLGSVPEFHPIVKRPQCEACGNPEILLRPPSSIELTFQNTEQEKLGGYRSVTHKETFDKYKHHISSLTGVVPKVKKIDYLPDGPIHNFSSGKNLALQSNSMFWLNMHQRTGNGGKGKN